MTPERQQYLIAAVSELINRVRDVDPERNQVWLNTLSLEDWRDMLIVLASMVDPSVPLPVALGWTFQLVHEEAA